MIAGIDTLAFVMSQTSITPRVSGARLPVTGMAAVLLAFKRAAVSQCHPRMLFALLMPFLIMFVFALLLFWLAWTPLTAWLDAKLHAWSLISDIDTWLIEVGLFSFQLWLIPLVAALILLPLAGILGVGIAAVCVMPLVLGHLENREYLGLTRQGRFTLAVSLWNAIWVGVVFVLGWLFTLPLWLLPPLGVLLSLFWWAFAFSYMMRLDSMVEHASAVERRELLRRHNGSYWLIGLLLSLFNLLPPAWVVLPVFSALVYGHYSLEALRQLRQDPVVDI